MDDTIFGPMSRFDHRAAEAAAQRRGLRHDHRRSPRAPQPGDYPIITVTAAFDHAITEVAVVLTEPESRIIPLRRKGTEWDALNAVYLEVWQGALPPQAAGTIVRYQIRATTGTGEQQWADEGATFSYLVGYQGPPAWAADAIVYQIFPDRFYPGDGLDWKPVNNLSDIYGGTLRGIIQKLDYIADLGFNTIWINPFFPDKTHHGYHATDHFSVNPRMGTLDDARELVDECHRRGIRLLLDFVANHWGSEHPTFQEALADRNSPYHDWYFWREWPQDYVAYFDVQDLPQVNVDHPAVRAYFAAVLRFWLGEIGFDGLRLDYANGPSHDFWVDMRTTAAAIKPDVWIFAEVVRPPDELLTYEGIFDGCLDFLLGQALRHTFGTGEMDVAAFDAFLGRHEAYFPAMLGRPAFLDNHDQDRFLKVCNGDKRRLKLAALCLFTLGNPPIVYNGTEVGVGQGRRIHEPDSQGMEECRQPMVWDERQDKELLDYFRSLIALRKNHAALRHGRRRTLHVDAAAGTYVYAREDGREAILVALNTSEEPRQIRVEDARLGIIDSFDLPPMSGDVHHFPL